MTGDRPKHYVSVYEVFFYYLFFWGGGGGLHLLAKRRYVQELERGLLVLENLRDGTRVRRSDE